MNLTNTNWRSTVLLDNLVLAEFGVLLHIELEDAQGNLTGMHNGDPLVGGVHQGNAIRYTLARSRLEYNGTVIGDTVILGRRHRRGKKPLGGGDDGSWTAEKGGGTDLGEKKARRVPKQKRVTKAKKR